MTRRPKNIIVFGHNGLVGSAASKLFADLGWNVITVDRSELDLRNSAEVSHWVAKQDADAAILAAAKVGGIKANATQGARFLIENLEIQNSVIPAVAKSEVPRFVFLGSSCIYPRDANQPLTVDALYSGKLEPTNRSYALAKLAGIELMGHYRSDFPGWCTVMPSNLYGSRDNFDLETGHVFASLIEKFRVASKNSHNNVTLWGDGTALREFTHASDLATALALCIEVDTLQLDPIINVGSGEEISIFNLASKIARIAGYRGEITWDDTMPNGTPRKLLDSSYIESLGWRPIVALEDGISQVLSARSGSAQ